MTKPILSIGSPDYDPYSGYGRKACELVAHLSMPRPDDEQRKDGVHVNVLYLDKAVYPTQTKALQDLLQKPIQMAFGGIVLGYPTTYGQYGAMLSNGHRVAQTMFESTQLPAGWVEILNECRAVAVPTPLQKSIMQKNGVRAPVHVVPEGVSETFRWVDRSRRQYSAKNPFKFVCWADRGMRKGWDVAVQAFVQAFGDRDDVQLVIKARENSFKFNLTNANIRIVREDFDEHQMQEFYAEMDCMIFPSRAEGFGLPPREFAATGGPALVTEWWASDVPRWGYPIHYKLVPAWQGESEALGKWIDRSVFVGLGEWAEPDVEHLIQQMQYIHQSKPEMRNYMGKVSAGNVRTLYSWKQFADGMYEVWQKAIQPRTDAELRARRKARKANQAKAVKDASNRTANQ